MTSITPLARRAKRNRAGKDIWVADRVVAARNAGRSGHYNKSSFRKI